jgi:hypothetical protein
LTVHGAAKAQIQSMRPRLRQCLVRCTARKKSKQMDKFIRSIDLQIAFNQLKNILLDKPEEIFQFVPDTVSAIANMHELNRNPKIL